LLLRELNRLGLLQTVAGEIAVMRTAR
jgi:hypothetical protein